MPIDTLARPASRAWILGLAIAGPTLVAGLPVLAHHGWAWAEGEQTELKGTIQKISMAPPHPAIMVTTSDGVVWQVDLGNPGQTARSGFTGDTAKAGDAITPLGNRHQDKSKLQMKAVRITVAGKNYDMYPDRIKAD